MSLVLDDMLQLGEGRLLLRREQRMEVVVLSLIVVQIIWIATQHIQQAEGVILERRLKLPVGARVKGSCLCKEVGRVGNLGRTHYEKAEQIKNPAHSYVLSVEGSSCLESICSGSPCLRSNSRELLDAAGHVRLVGEAKLSRDACEWRLSILNRLQSMAGANAGTERLW